MSAKRSPASIRGTWNSRRSCGGGSSASNFSGTNRLEAVSLVDTAFGVLLPSPAECKYYRSLTSAGRLWPFEVEVAARTWPLVDRAALVPVDGKGVLAIEGDPMGLPNWQTLARKLKVKRVVHINRIPLDHRHRSKVDYGALEELVRDEL